MKERWTKKLIRFACMLTAVTSLAVCSGCDDLLLYLDELLSSTESSGDGGMGDSSSKWWEESASEKDSSAWQSSSSEQGSSSEQSSSNSSAESSADNSSSGETVVDALDFSILPIERAYGYTYLQTQTNGNNLQKFYKDFYNLCVNFASSTRNVPSKTVNYTGGEKATVYEMGELNFSKYGLSQEEVVTIWSVSMVDFPQFYWISHTASYTATTLNVYIDGEYATYAERKRVNDGLKERANECYSYIPKNATQTEKALSIADYIMANMQYAYETDGVTPQDDCWAHNLEGIVLQKGVCESYAKVYDYFCALMGVENITVTGYAGTGNDMGGHAWNIVKIDDVWYDVDLTWEDAYENPNREWVGVPASEFDTTHVASNPNNGYGNAWLYGLPTRSQTRMQPVSVKENNGEETYYPTLDFAFAALTNSQSTYQINVCPSTKAAVGEGLTIHPYDVDFSTTALPQTQGVTLTGKYVSANNQSKIIAKNSISVTSAIVIEYGTFTYPRTSSGTSKITTGTRGTKKTSWF